MRALTLLLVTSITATLSPAVAQVRDRTARPGAAAPAPVADAAAIARGWAALSEGRPTDAVAAADRLLASRPWDHAALVLKIAALSSVDPARALDAYEQRLGLGGGDDIGLLEPIAIGTLQHLASGGDPLAARDALAQLVRAHVPGAEAALASLGAREGGPNQLAADAALARAGDPQALGRLSSATMADTPADKTPVARALEQTGPAGVPGLVRLAVSPNPMTRAAAVQALGRMHTDTARAALDRAAGDPDPFVRSSATVALAKLGDQQALDRVRQMIDSEVPDIRIMAADAWEGRDGPWVAAIMPLLDNTDGLVRLQAAKLIAPVNPDAARRALGAASTDPNPVVRAETAKIMDEIATAAPEAASVAELRRLLRDRDPATRVAAAGALLSVVRSGRR